MSFSSYLRSKASRCWEVAKSTGRKLAVPGAVTTSAVITHQASAEAILPDLGVDVPGMIGEMTTSIGAIILAGVGLTAAVIVTYKGIKYLRRAG